MVPGRNPARLLGQLGLWYQTDSVPLGHSASQEANGVGEPNPRCVGISQTVSWGLRPEEALPHQVRFLVIVMLDPSRMTSALRPGA